MTGIMDMPRRKIMQRMLALGATALTLGMRSRSDATPKPSANAAPRWGVDYGAATDPVLARTCALLMLEPHHARPIAPLRGPGSILLGYVSFGEVERSRPYFAALAWVFAVPLFELIGADARAIFAFRQTSLGTVFHLVVIATTVVLAYYDLFGRILLTWTAFAIGSGIATLLQWDAGFAAFGWGYMAGAVVGASVGMALVAEATVNLTYLLFVGNNPSVVGHGGRLL